MKKLIVICAVLALLSSSAIADMYVETVDVYIYSVGGTINYNHTYTPGDAINWATLTIVADDVDGPGNGMDGEQDMVSIQVGSTWYNLGNLNDMGYYTNFNYQPGAGNANQPLTTTVFNLDPAWLGTGFPVAVNVEASWGVEIETSTLTVERVPVPGALLLGSLGLGFAAWRLKRRKMA